MDGIVLSYPIKVDVIIVDSWQWIYTLQYLESLITFVESLANVFSLQQIIQDICNLVVTIENGNIDKNVVLISHADAREVVMWNVFHNKEILKISFSFYPTQNKFEYKVLRLNKKKYMLKCSNSDCNWIFRSSCLKKQKCLK